MLGCIVLCSVADGLELSCNTSCHAHTIHVSTRYTRSIQRFLIHTRVRLDWWHTALHTVLHAPHTLRCPHCSAGGEGGALRKSFAKQSEHPLEQCPMCGRSVRSVDHHLDTDCPNAVRNTTNGASPVEIGSRYACRPPHPRSSPLAPPPRPRPLPPPKATLPH